MEDTITAAIREIVREEVQAAIEGRHIPVLPPQTIFVRGKNDSIETHYSVAQIAKLLSVSKDWVYARIYRGELVTVDLGGSRSNLRVSASELGRWLKQRASRPLLKT